MVKITRVYTKTGDKGVTSISHNRRLPKSSIRIEAIGNIDQLNAFLGFAIVAFQKKRKLNLINNKMLRIQQELFDYGAALAETRPDKLKNMLQYLPTYIQRLEKEIDQINKKLPSLTSFVLPGGNEIAARLHLARTICRTAELSIVKLHEEQKLSIETLAYINRLSDWLFVVARFITYQLKEKEILWQPFASPL